MAGRKPAKKAPAERKRRLTDQQRLFVAFYLQKQNGAWAARKAGYAEDRARQTAHELLASPDVQKAIRRGFEKLLDQHYVTAGRIIRELERIAFADITSLVSWDEDGNVEWTASDDLDPDFTAALSKFTRKHSVIPQKGGGDPIERTELQAEQHNKLQALKLLAELLRVSRAGEDDGDKESEGIVVLPADSDDWRGLAHGG